MLKPLSIGLIWVVAMYSPAARSNQPRSTVKAITYELYSWRGEDHTWKFSLVPSPSGSPIDPDTVFESKFVLSGTTALKSRISDLPEGTTILWFDRISNFPEESSKREGEVLAYPSRRMVDQLKWFASTHKVRIHVVPDAKGP